jgi:hypothetical protein
MRARVVENHKEGVATLAYRVVTASSTKERICYYRELLKNGVTQVGRNLRAAIGRGRNVVSLSPADFADALMTTRIPQIFAESQVAGDGPDWNEFEEGISGDVGVAVSVVIHDDGAFPPGRPRRHARPFEGELLFVSGPLLNVGGRRRDIPPDLAEAILGRGESVAGEGILRPLGRSGGEALVKRRYDALIERRLFPMLRYASDKALEKGVTAQVRMGGWAPASSPAPWKGQMHRQIDRAVFNILAARSAELPGIRYVDVFYHDEELPVTYGQNVASVGGTTYRAGLFGYNQQARPEGGCRLYKVVASPVLVSGERLLVEQEPRDGRRSGGGGHQLVRGPHGRRRDMEKRRK